MVNRTAVIGGLSKLAQTQVAEQAWISELPRFVEQVGPNTWRGELPDGRMVAVRRLAPGDANSHALKLEHLRRLAELAHPNLTPILGAARDGESLFAISAWIPGSDVESLLARYPLSASQATMIGLGALDGLAALQRAGLAHGKLTADKVLVDRQGTVRLAAFALEPRIRPGHRTESLALGWPDPKQDLAAVGAIVSSALGTLGSAPPALAVTARAMSTGELGRDPSSVRGLLADSAGLLAGAAAQQQAATELGFLASATAGPISRSVSRVVKPAIPPPTPPATRPSPAPAPGVQQPARATARGRNWAVIGALGLLGILLLAGLAAQAGIFSLARSATVVQRATAHKAVRVQASKPLPHSAAVAKAPPRAAAAPPQVAPKSPAAQPAGNTVPASLPAPAPAGAGSPTGAVSAFYGVVGQHDFSAAANLWSSRMQQNYPPGYYINGRFANTTGFALRQDRLISLSGSRASVYIDLVEYKGGSTYHWAGTWYLVNNGGGWLLDSPSLSGGQVA